MIVVIIAGGSGTRLWPLSTPDYPKHLLSLTGKSSLIQSTFARASKLTDLKSIFVVSELSHAHHVHAQLKDLSESQMVVEPARRGTASCVIRVLQHLKKLGVDEFKPIVFLWADHLINDVNGFIDTFNKASKLVSMYQKNVFIGVNPKYASTGFGYLKKGDILINQPNTYELAEFKEKPDAKTAKKYIENGKYLWNTGYLLTSISVFETTVALYAPDLERRYHSLETADDIDEAYLKLESEAIDYAFSEKLDSALIVTSDFDWADVGSFADLDTISSHDPVGNHLQGEKVIIDSATNSYFRNETTVPLVVIGLDNVVVVQTKHGTLVINKDFSQRVGEVSKKIEKA